VRLRTGYELVLVPRSGVFAIIDYGIQMNISDCAADFKHYFLATAPVRADVLAADIGNDSRRGAGAAEPVGDGKPF
jgi:hypothetical protein